MIDLALEKSRRTAWARFYRCRAELDQMGLWAAELAEWLDAFADDLPPQATQLIELVRQPVSHHDRVALRRYVVHHSAVPA